MTIYVHRVLIDHVVSARPWVAQIVGLDRHFGLARDFVTPLLDYKRASSTMRGATCGVVACFPLEDGVYQFSEPDRKHPKKYYARVSNGAISKRMTEDEVKDWALQTSQSIRSGRRSSRRRRSGSRGPSTRSRSFT